MQKVYELLQKLELKPIYNKYDKEINAINVKIQIQPIVKFYKVIFYKNGEITNIFFFKQKNSVIDLLKNNAYSLGKIGV